MSSVTVPAYLTLENSCFGTQDDNQTQISQQSDLRRADINWSRIHAAYLEFVRGGSISTG